MLNRTELIGRSAFGAFLHHRLDNDDPLLVEVPSDVLDLEIPVGSHEETYSEWRRTLLPSFGESLSEPLL